MNSFELVKECLDKAIESGRIATFTRADGVKLSIAKLKFATKVNRSAFYQNKDIIALISEIETRLLLASSLKQHPVAPNSEKCISVEQVEERRESLRIEITAALQRITIGCATLRTAAENALIAAKGVSRSAE